MVSPAPLKSAQYRPAFIGLGFWFTLLVWVWPAATQVINGDNALSLDAQLSTGQRPEIWAMMLDGIAHRPWFGYGWNQGRLVQLAELPKYADLQIGVQHAHNVVLDLLVWNGIPLGLVLTGLLAGWFWWQLKRAVTASQILLLLALTTFMLHAMLELPHCKAFFLVPVALMMGTLNAQSSLPVLFHLPRLMAIGIATTLAGTLVLTWMDYRNIEVDLRAYEMRTAWPGISPAPPKPDIYVLKALQFALATPRSELRQGMSTEELEYLRRLVSRYPIESALFRYARAAALNGQPEAAQETLTRWCQLFSKDRCKVARTAWSEFLAEHPEAKPVTFPNIDLQPADGQGNP
jgi:hypothetical protein